MLGSGICSPIPSRTRDAGSLNKRYHILVWVGSRTIAQEPLSRAITSVKRNMKYPLLRVLRLAITTTVTLWYTFYCPGICFSHTIAQPQAL